jgi:uncharacterized membrane protein
MTLTHVLLGVTAVTTGLFTGLLMTILFFFQRALKDLSGPEFALVMQRFLGIVRTHPLNCIMVIVSGTAPIVALVTMRDNPGSPAFVFALLGSLAFWCGSILPSRFSAEPIYDVFLSWEADAPPKDWQRSREKYFRLNVIRGLGSGVAFVCFVVSLAVLAP